jgi:integrase
VTTSKRGQGEGGIASYDTAGGERWSIVYRAYDRERGARRQFRKGGFVSKAEAQKALRKALQQVDDGEHVTPSSFTLRAFVEQRWLPAVQGELRPSTFSSYSRNLRLHVLPALGATSLQRLDAGQLQALYGVLLARGRKDHKEGRALSVRTVRYIHTILKSALQAAVEWDLVRTNPAAKVKSPKQSAATGPEGMRTWDRDQVRASLASTEGDRLRTLWLVLLTTGMRRGEALGLCWDAVDLDTGRLKVTRTLVDLGPGGEPVWSDPKTLAGRRVIALDSGTVAALRTHRAQQLTDRLAVGAGWSACAKGDGGLVFTMPDGGPLHPERLSRRFQAGTRRAGLPMIRLHDLRHTHATLALEAGVNAKVMQERLGHADVSITLRVYSHVSQTLASDVAEQVARLIL